MKILFLMLLTSLSAQAFTLAGVQQAKQLITWQKVTDGVREGRYSGYRAVMNDMPQSKGTTLIVYAPTCAAGLAAVMKENGKPNAISANAEGPKTVVYWSNRDSLRVSCSDGVTYAHLSKK